MTDIHLMATNEAVLAAALPWLRGSGDDGAAVWLEASPFHALVPGVLIVAAPAEADETGEIVREAEIAPGFHAELRLILGHPDYVEILDACAPFLRAPETPQHDFAEGGLATVPPVISDRQFAQVLAIEEIITEDEALAWAARGDLPEALEAAVGQLPEANRFGARMLLAAATSYERAHPLVGVLGEILGRDDTALDDIWRRAAAL